MDYSPAPLSPMPAATAADTRTPAAFFWVLGLSLLAALVPTVWTDLDLRAAALFTGPSQQIYSAQWWWVLWINNYVPLTFRVVLAVLAGLWLLARKRALWPNARYALAFVVVAGVLGPGVVVNWAVKNNWERARPYQVENFGGAQKFTRAAVPSDQCDNNCSFVSGHVACGAFLVAVALVHRRRALAWSLAGVVTGLVIGFARMSDVAHWLSDVLWAYPITLLSCWLVWKAMQVLQAYWVDADDEVARVNAGSHEGEAAAESTPSGEGHSPSRTPG